LLRNNFDNLVGIKNDTFVFPEKLYCNGDYVEGYTMRYIHSPNLFYLNRDISIDEVISSLDVLLEDIKKVSDLSLIISDLKASNVLFKDVFNIVDTDFYIYRPELKDIYRENVLQFCRFFYLYMFSSQDFSLSFENFFDDSKELKGLNQILYYNGDFDLLKEFLVKYKNLVSTYAGCEVDNLKETHKVLLRECVK